MIETITSAVEKITTVTNIDPANLASTENLVVVNALGTAVDKNEVLDCTP